MAIGCCLMVIAGCGGGGEVSDGQPAGDDGSSSDGTPAVETQQDGEVYKYTVAEVSPMGHHGPPLDGGNIELAPPKNWNVGSRQASMVVWYHEFKDAKLLPQIRVKAEDAPEGAPQNATVDSAKEYAQWVDGWLKKQIGDETLLEPVVPLVLGDNAFGRYVRKGSYKESPAERMTLVTTVDGRIYTIETIVFQGALQENRKMVLDGYAVGASLRKPEAGGVGGFQPPGEG